ncbi:hypothetical protein R6Q57_027498 [Mikania cordata]
MNPRPNNLNQEFNSFSYDPESLRNFYAQLQQNPNFQHFQPNFQTLPNFPPGAGPSSGPMTPKQWTPDEETALGRCFMDESENKTKGNSQKRENF